MQKKKKDDCYWTEYKIREIERKFGNTTERITLKELYETKN